MQLSAHLSHSVSLTINSDLTRNVALDSHGYLGYRPRDFFSADIDKQAINATAA